MAAVTELDSIQHADLFDLCAELDAASVDMILCDLPYGTTACSWDTVIPFAPMWEAFKRVIKPRGAIVLTASQPFTSALVMSNVEMFRHEWIWQKNNGSNFMNLKHSPMKEHESVIVFGASGTAYYPQRIKRTSEGSARARRNYLCRTTAGRIYGDNFKLAHARNKPDPNLRAPSTVLEFDTEVGLHPTQKPVALFRYLIRTYTQPGDVVLDPCVGSGTTALAAREEQRHWVCGDSSAEYVAIAQKRMDAPYTLPLFVAEG